MLSSFQNVMRSRGMTSATFAPELMQFVVGSMCGARTPQEDICLRMTFAIVGEDYEQNDWVCRLFSLSAKTCGDESVQPISKFSFGTQVLLPRSFRNGLAYLENPSERSGSEFGCESIIFVNSQPNQTNKTFNHYEKKKHYESKLLAEIFKKNLGLLKAVPKLIFHNNNYEFLLFRPCRKSIWRDSSPHPGDSWSISEKLE